jgi:ATP-dependent Lhr-like helicase
MGYDKDAYQRNKADALFRMGFHSEVIGRTDDAVKKYESALRAHPTHYESHVQLGRIYRKRGIEQKAHYHESMAQRSRSKVHQEAPRPAPKREITAPSPPIEVKRSVEVTKEEVADAQADALIKKMLPLVWGPFYGRFDNLREVQRLAVPVVLGGSNALIISSTAGGKTEAVFAPLTQRLIMEGWQGTSIIYISPTRALASDIRGRLESMLTPLGIKAALRSGDIKELDRTNPQDVLVTTPESLDSMVSRMPALLKDVRAIVLDELHMVDGSYRGDQLRILLRRIEALSNNPVSIYGASATVSDPMGLALRYMSSPIIVSSPGGRDIDYQIVPSLEKAARAFREKELKKCLVFCNTPEEAETLANGELRQWFPPSVLKVHHGKLQVPKRAEAERALRSEAKVVCACTSTLEVGVDIGDIDMVILANRPRSVASIAQRIGRANRREERINTVAVARSAGEAAYYEKVFEAIARSKYASEERSFDPSVVVQQVLSSLSGPAGAKASEVQGLFCGLMPAEEVRAVWEHLHDGGWIEQDNNGRWSIGKRAREFGPKVHSNIPGSESIEVVEADSGQPIGNIALPIDNIFVLGGQAWMVRKKLNGRVMVSQVDSGTDVANFASYDRFGAFFDLLPAEIKLRHRREMGAS